LDFSVQIYNELTHPIAIEKYVQHYIYPIFKTFICNKGMKGLILSRMYVNLSINQLNSIKPNELLITLGGLNDGIRKGIWADSADRLINRWEQIMPYDHLYAYINAINPFIVDFWNSKSGMIDCTPINMENVFNRWDIASKLDYFDDCVINKCHHCANDVMLKQQSTVCKVCDQLFHYMCFNQETHECKSQHHEEEIDLLAEQMEMM
jgi:hypothetical protein